MILRSNTYNLNNITWECCRCQIIRPISHFLKKKTKGYCQLCRIDYRKKYAKTIQGRMNILARTAKKNATLRGLKSRMDKSGECTINSKDLKQIYINQNGLCVITKLPLSMNSHINQTISLDRMDDTKGYHVDNCQLVCVAMNAPRKFESKEILQFPLVQYYAIAREAALVARMKQRRRQHL